MNTYIFLRRIKGPVIIVVFGITALLNQWDVLSYGQSWPLYLIALGLLMLAERAAWSRMQYPPEGPVPAQYASGSVPPQPAAPQQTSTALSISPWNEGRK